MRRVCCGFGSGFGAVGLGQGKDAERNKHCRVEGAAIEKEDINELLEVSGFGCAEGVGEVLGGR